MIPPGDLDTILDNIGLPTSGSNLAYSDNPNIGPGDGDILIALKPDHVRSGDEYRDLLRKRLNARFPEATFYFEAANMTNQILNFGLPAPIDVQIVGRNAEANYALAREVERRDRAHSRRRRRAHSPDRRLPRNPRERRPQPGRAVRA